MKIPSSASNLPKTETPQICEGEMDEGQDLQESQKVVSSPSPLTAIPPPSRTWFENSKPYTERTNIESEDKGLPQDWPSSLSSEDVVGQNPVSLCQILSQITILRPNPKPLQSCKAYQNSKMRPLAGLKLQSRWENMNLKSKKGGLEDLRSFQENFWEIGGTQSMIAAATESQDMTPNGEQPLQTTRNRQLIGKVMMDFFKEFEKGKQKRSLMGNPLCTEIWIIILRELYCIQSQVGKKFSIPASFWNLRLVSRTFNSILSPLACRHLQLNFPRASGNIDIVERIDMSRAIRPYQAIFYSPGNTKSNLRRDYVIELTAWEDTWPAAWDVNMWLAYCNKSVLINFIYSQATLPLQSSNPLRSHLTEGIKKALGCRLSIQNCTLSFLGEQKLLNSFPAENLVALELHLPEGFVSLRLQKFLVSATKLETLKLRRNKESGGKYCFLVGEGRLPPVKELYMQGYNWPWSDNCTDAIWDFSRLQHLYLDRVCLLRFLLSTAHIDFSKLKTLALRDTESRYTQQKQIIAGLKHMLSNPVYLEKLTAFFRKSALLSRSRVLETELFKKLTQTTRYPDEVKIGRIHVNRGVEGAVKFWDTIEKALPAGLASSHP